MGIFGHAPTGRGTIFIFAANFHPIEGGARSAGQRVSYLFARLNLPCPAIGLSYPAMSLVRLALLLPLGPKTYVDSRQRPTAANEATQIFKRGMNAFNNPEFYRQLRQDPDQITTAALRLLAEKFNLTPR
jgi:hypothetical protein